MTMIKNLAYFCGFVALASGCDVKQDLGETAGETESSSSGTTSGSGDTGVLDTGPGEESGNLSESTSGDTGWADSGPWEETGDSTVSATGGETETGAELCEESDVLLRWESQSFIDDLGVEAEFAGEGDCTVSEAKPAAPDLIALQLECTLSGTADDEDVVDRAYTLALEFTASDVSQVTMPTFAPIVHARIVVAPAGLELTGERHLVLEQSALPGDGFAPVIIATDAHGIEPNAFQYADWHEGDWFAGPSITATDASCETGSAPRCGFDVAMEAGWIDLIPVALHGGQQGSFGAPTSDAGYAFHVDAAWQAPEARKCGVDFPSAEYRFVVVAAGP